MNPEKEPESKPMPDPFPVMDFPVKRKPIYTTDENCTSVEWLDGEMYYFLPRYAHD